MADKKKVKNGYEFSGLPFYDIIAKPLIAIARAQSMMAKEQLRSMLETCFYFDGHVYRPILLKMTVMRSVLEPAKRPGESPSIDHVTAFFYLPMVTIFPLNALGIENADLDFNIEVTSQYGTNTNEDESNFPEGNFLNKRSKGIELKGKITGGAKPVVIDNDKDTYYNHDKTSSLHINVEAGTLPLTKGLLEIINIYTSAIHVSDIKEDHHEQMTKSFINS